MSMSRTITNPQKGRPPPRHCPCRTHPVSITNVFLSLNCTGCAARQTVPPHVPIIHQQLVSLRYYPCGGTKNRESYYSPKICQQAPYNSHLQPPAPFVFPHQGKHTAYPHKPQGDIPKSLKDLPEYRTHTADDGRGVMHLTLQFHFKGRSSGDKQQRSTRKEYHPLMASFRDGQPDRVQQASHRSHEALKHPSVLAQGIIGGAERDGRIVFHRRKHRKKHKPCGTDSQKASCAYN